MSDQKFMARAIALAERARGQTNPNPLVGAVIVKNNIILATGYHKKAGEAHAEIEALKKLNFRAIGATLYVSLEPCCHFGRTGPCTEKIIKSGITRVVAATMDPNSKVCGKGFDLLRKKNIRVECGLLENRAILQNESYFKFIKSGLPLVTIKAGITLDGKIALRDGRSKWISSPETMEFTRRNRTKYDAIVVGINTVIMDDPLLEPSQIKGNRLNPAKVIIDPSLKISEKARLIQENKNSKIYIFTNKQEKGKKVDLLLRIKDLKIIEVDAIDGIISTQTILRILANFNIMSVLIEGGGKTNGFFLRDRMADKIMLCYSPRIFGNNKSQGFVDGLNPTSIENTPIIKNYTIKKIGDDFILTGYVEYFRG